MEAGIVTIPPTTTGTTAGEVLSEDELDRIYRNYCENTGHNFSIFSTIASLIASHRTLQRELAASQEREARLAAFVAELIQERHSIPATIAAVEARPESERAFSLDYWQGYLAVLEWAVDDIGPHFGIDAALASAGDAGREVE